MLVAPLCLQANVPLAVQINGPKKLATGSSKVPYTCDVQGKFNGTILSYCWSCTGEGGEDYSDLFDGGTNTYEIFITDAPTNFWLDVQVRYRSNTNSNEYILATEAKIRVMKPSFNIVREAGLNGGNPTGSTSISMHMNIDDDDHSAESCSLIYRGQDYLQNFYEENDCEDDMLYFKITTSVPGLEVKYGKLKVIVSQYAKIWKSPNKGNNALLFDSNTTTEVDGSNLDGSVMISSFLKKEVYVEGVGLGNINITVEYNDNEIANMPYNTFAPALSRIPVKEEREWCESSFPDIDGCEFGMKSDFTEMYCPTYNCIAYCVLPNMSSNPSSRFWVEDFFPNYDWFAIAHSCLIYSYISDFYIYDDVKYTSMDLFGNQNQSFEYIDRSNFFTFYHCLQSYFYLAADFYYFGNYHGAKKANLNEKLGFYNINDVVVSKCGEGSIMVHYASSVANVYGLIIDMYIYDPL